MSPPRRANGWRSRSCSTTTNGRTARPAAAATWMRSRYCWPVTAVAGKARSAVEQGQRVLADLLWRVGGGVALHHMRSEEHTSELQSLLRISYAVFCLKKKRQTYHRQLMQP